jgi:hypothetical protein
MFEALRIFEVRIPFEEEYQTPSIDTLNGSGSALVILPPPAPILTGITGGGLTWETIFNNGVTQYTVEALCSGTIWETIATVVAPTLVQIIWTGSEWDIQQFISGAWQTLYRGFQPLIPAPVVGDTAVQEVLLTPNLVPIWYMPDGVTVVSGITFSLVGAETPNDLIISGAPNSAVNTTYEQLGSQNGRNAYMGPEVTTYNFTPSTTCLYRVQAFNSAGPGAYSNIISYSIPAVLDVFYSSSQLASGNLLIVPTGSTGSFILSSDNPEYPATITSISLSSGYSIQLLNDTGNGNPVTLPVNLGSLAGNLGMVINTPGSTGVTGTMIILSSGSDSPFTVNLTT